VVVKSPFASVAVTHTKVCGVVVGIGGGLDIIELVVTAVK
jgi:hypothetical protein